MLPRLILLALLAFLVAGGLAQPAAQQQPGLITRLMQFHAQRSGGSAFSDSDDGPCKGTRCARLGNLPVAQEARSATEATATATVTAVVDEDEDGDEEDDGTAVEEGRGKKKKKKGYGKYIVMAGMTKAIILYFMIHAVAALAGKALVIAKVALAIATALALKKSSDHKTSYEIVKHPQYSSVHTHSQSVDYDHGGGYEGGSRRRRTARR